MRSILRRLFPDRSSERGQALVLLALAFSVVLAGGGIALDAGMAYVERRHGQVAADAAAYAAAVELVKNWDAANRGTLAADAARAYASTNGYVADATTAVTINNPPTSGAYVGNADYVEVLIRRDVRTTFVRILGPVFATLSVQARAVGGSVPPAKPYSIIALSKTASPGLDVNGQVQLRADEAGILVNSSDSAALQGTGGAQIMAEPFGTDVVGGIGILTPGVDVRGPLNTGAAQVPNPLAYLTPPTGAGLPSFGDVVVTGGDVVIVPGIYQSIQVSGTGKVSMQPGTYIIKGGGIQVTGAGELKDNDFADGQGVFIYNACSDFPAPSGTCGAIMTAGNGRVDLNRSTTGTYAGISIWQPCENTQTLSITGKSSGTSSHKFETSGTIYLPCAAARAFGGGEFEGLIRVRDGQLVANTVSLGGKAQIFVDWDSSVGNTSRTPAIVE